MSDTQFVQGEWERLRAVVDELREAVVAVDTVRNHANANKTAAHILGLARGVNPMSAFTTALAGLADRALNGTELLAAVDQLGADPGAEISCTLRFTENPTHLVVTSTAIRQAGFDGRVWVFYDESALSQALESSERTRVILQASADGMLDPQALLQGVRSPDGEIVDFIYRDVNNATCAYLGMPRDELVGRTLLETMPNLGPSGLLTKYVECAVTHEPMILDNVCYDNEILADSRYYDIRGNHVIGDFITLTWRDVTERSEAVARIAASEEQYRLLAANAVDVVAHIRDGLITWVSPSVEAVLGAPPEYWVGRKMQETVPLDELANQAAIVARIQSEGEAIARSRVIAKDGTPHWIHLHGRRFYDADGNLDGLAIAFRVIDDEVRIMDEAEEARRQQAEADARYRRLMDNAAVGMCMVTPDGRYDTVNQALCDFLGYDAQTLTRMSWQQLTTGATLDRDLQNADDLLAGRIDFYRVTKQYIHADGHLIWGDLSVSCLRDANGQVEYFVSQVIDITAEMEGRRRIAQRDQQNRALTHRLQAQTDRLKSELNSAAKYVRSILPRDLTEPVRVVSRYVPSQELGGDCFDHTWIDDDHMLVYLIDVSGHGVAPALLCISVYNLLRSGRVPNSTLLAPDRVLSELNSTFQMDQHGDNYFTIWYGVYEKSTRTLRYSSAGHPPALVFTTSDGQVTTTRLSTGGLPLGMFEDAEYHSENYEVPTGAQLLIYSDGTFELPLPKGHWSLPEFVELCAELALDPEWTLEDLIAELKSLTADGLFDDDCSLVQVTF